jgi:TetR/AcrR family transcriptional regulator, mexJK operon transcriptional repressor
MKKTSGRPKGRPRSAERLQRVVESATEQFLRAGFDRTTMESVAEQAGVSKVTVYSYFASKEELMSAVVARLSDRVAGFDMDGSLDPAQPREAMRMMGLQFLRLMRDEQVVAQHRVLFGLSSTHEQLCRAYYDHGPARIIEGVSRYFRAADRQGTLRVPAPAVAADEFLSILLGAANIRAMLGLERATEADNELHVKSCVDTMLRAYAVRT